MKIVLQTLFNDNLNVRLDMDVEIRSLLLRDTSYKFLYRVYFCVHTLSTKLETYLATTGPGPLLGHYSQPSPTVPNLVPLSTSASIERGASNPRQFAYSDLVKHNNRNKWSKWQHLS